MSTHQESRISAYGSEAKVDVRGAYLTSWQVPHQQSSHEQILYQGSVLKRTGIPLLFPYFGKAEGKRQHGFGRDSAWQLVEELPDKVVLSLSSTEISSEAHQEYPYVFDAKLVIQIAEEKSLIYELQVKNTGTVDLPVTPGVHPYWPVAHDLKQTVKVTGLPEFNATQIDWNASPPDIAYPYLGELTIHFPDRKVKISDISSPPVIRYVVVWSQSPDKDDYNFICVEPVCGVNNDLIQDPLFILPGQEWQMKLRFSVAFG